jgi:prepilin-type N-terminal cleavage/methylation domain-containing protein
MPEVITMKSNDLQWRDRFALHYLTHQKRTTRSGFTLIESLVAIIILSLTVVSVFPPIFWATATRVQNRRAEQALQLAQGEIDRVRVAVERKAVTPTQLPQVINPALIKPDAPAPTTVISENVKLRSAVPGCNKDDGNPGGVNEVILVDTDPEAPGSKTPCAPEFMIQTFRGAGRPFENVLTGPDAFVMGVRVYSITARNNVTAGTAQKGEGTLRGSTGLGTQQIKPLATLYSTIVRSNKSDSLDIYRQLCNSVGQQGCAPPP